MSQEVNGAHLPDDKPWAFPWNMKIETSTGTVHATCPGMEMRDWFAGQIAAGIVANQRTTGGAGDVAKTVGEYAYAIADALMRARERK